MNISLSPIVVRTTVFGVAVIAGITATALSPFLTASVAAEAASTATTYQANLTPLNNSGASGTTSVVINGNDVTVTIRATGTSPNRAHAAHIYVGGKVACPTAAADSNKDTSVDNNEAKAFRGDLKVSLTTSGDIGPNSALAFNRMPVADKDGKIAYSRTFTLPAGIKPADLAKASVDLQGISTLFNSKVIYDGDKRSELTKDHAFETTIPAACGVLSTAPLGGAATGVGSTSGVESPALFVAGITALSGALFAGFIARKQFSK